MPDKKRSVKPSELKFEGVEGSSESAVAAELAQALEQAEATRDELIADLQRVAADFDNYRKRVTREQEALVQRAHARLVEALLPVLDDLERALGAAAIHEEAKLEDGVQLVHRQLSDVLAKEGLVEIATDGIFDPHVHEALAAVPAQADEGTILDVTQKGYLLGDRVLRPARVIVASSPPEE